MRTIQTIITCDICHETCEDYRSERVGEIEYTYCYDCFSSHAHECDICQDHFVHIVEHKAPRAPRAPRFAR